MEIIKLNIIPSGVNPTCHASQYDEGRVIRVELYEGLTPFTLQASDEIGLSIRKPDDKIVTMVVENTEDNYVDIVTTKQACAIVGANLCELTIKRSSVNIGTLNFYMQVERDPLADGDDSESEIRDLQERVNACVEIALADLYDGTSVLFDDEPVLDHDAPYTVSSDGIARAFRVVNTALAGKVDNSYLTTNYYNKTQVDGALSGKVDNSALEYYYTKNETYSKTEVNNLFSAFGIDDLYDVEIDEQTLAAGQGIVYDAVTGKFTNGEVSSTSTLEELTDTDINNKQDGDGILFNATSNKWINQAITKELSQAAYDNLSQAEKENGTAYYVPDATSSPVDASDVGYSAGVTVKDKLDSNTDAINDNAAAITALQTGKQDKATLLSDIVKKVVLSGATNSTGDIVADTLAVGTAIIISATKVRNANNTNIGFSSLARNAVNDRYIIHLQDASGTPLANQNVEVIVHYIETY